MLAPHGNLAETPRIVEIIRCSPLLDEIGPDVEHISTFVNVDGDFMVQVGDILLGESEALVRNLVITTVAQFSVSLYDIADFVVLAVLGDSGSLIQVHDKELRQCSIEIKFERGIGRKLFRPFVDRAGCCRKHHRQNCGQYFNSPVFHRSVLLFLRSKLYENDTAAWSIPTNVV